MKKLLEMTLENGESVFMEIEDHSAPMRGGTDSGNPVARNFSEAIRCVQPVASSLLASLQDINTPAEIKLEFGLTFNAKAGVVFTSLESQASFKVGITWKNDKK